MEDQWARHLLVGQLKQLSPHTTVDDFPVDNQWNRNWRTLVEPKIRATYGTIVIVGETTAESLAVQWEIELSRKLGHPLAAIRLPESQNATIPPLLEEGQVVSWDVTRLADLIGKWLE